MALTSDSMKIFDDLTPPSEELTQQAWTWLRKFNSGDVTQWEAQAFKRWLHTSPAHQAAFGAARHQWSLLEPAATAALQNNPEGASPGVRSPVSPGRRVFLGGAVSAAVAAGVAVALPSASVLWSPSLWDADYRTGTGEQRTVQLAVQVNVMLNTQTSIRRQIRGETTTGIDLLTGEVAIDSFSAQPFTVVAASGQSMAASGQFEVRRLEGKVCVTCINGLTQVKHPAGNRELQARQQLIYNDSRISDIAGIEPAAVSAWRRGELVFNQMPLAQVIGEINRYRPGRVVLMNKAAGGKPVSGSFDIQLLDQALTQLQLTFNLHARALPAGLTILS